MNPAISVIFFTVASGSGYGLLFLLGMALILDPQLLDRREALLVLGVGAALAAAGLSSSLLHLGQPQRAWRALSQWQSSWLSREGVAALLSFVPILLTGIAIWREADAIVVRADAAALALMAVVTVCCTEKIYTSLKTIHAWHNPYVLFGYLLFALLGGATWLWLLHEVVGHEAGPAQVGLAYFIVALALAGWLLKRAYWTSIDTTRHPATIESATGLGRFGQVNSVERPHTEENYLTREMGFLLARKHAQRLRTICLILLGPATAVFAVVVPLLATRLPMLAPICALGAAVCAMAGLFVERWLFFAEAKHVVMLYYGPTHP